MYGTYAAWTFGGVIALGAFLLALVLMPWAPIFAVLIAIVIAAAVVVGRFVLGAGKRADAEEDEGVTATSAGPQRKPSGRPASGEGT